MVFYSLYYAFALLVLGATVNAQTTKLKPAPYFLLSVNGPAYSDPGDMNPIKTHNTTVTAYDLWNVTGTPEAGYTFRNIKTDSYAYSTGEADKPVFSHPKLSTAWSLASLGKNTWTISYPGKKDLLWTAKGEKQAVLLNAPVQSGDSQKWKVYGVPKFTP